LQATRSVPQINPLKKPAKLRFDDMHGYGMIGSVSFRLFNANWGRAAMAALCLAFAGSVRAQEGTRSIEVVPFHNGNSGTNFQQLPQSDSQNFDVWKPSAPNSAAPSARITKPVPLPQTQPTLSKEDQQLLDRRRNWVFMTPEDYATTDTKTGKSLLGTEDDKEKNMTAMERYFHRLEQSSTAAATNQFNRMNTDRLNAQTNSYGGVARNNDSGTFATPFNTAPDAGIFQPLTSENAGNVFGKADNSGPNLTPDEVRLQAEHKARMETYKQLWDIDQAGSASTPTTAPASGPIDSAPLFGASTPGMSSSFKPPGSTPGNGFGKSSPAPAARPSATPRYTPPPHSDFTPPQRPF
jgi:hypothetical protein